MAIRRAGLRLRGAGAGARAGARAGASATTAGRTPAAAPTRPAAPAVQPSRGAATPPVTPPPPATSATTPTRKPIAAPGLEAAAAAARAHALEAARADVALVKKLNARITEDFWEMGKALGRLKAPLHYMALGYASFHDLCRAELGLKPTVVDQLVAIAANMPAVIARGIGQTGALQLLQICKATQEDDTPADIVDAKIPLPSGGVLDVGRATTREREKAIRELREARPQVGKRGRGVSAAERQLAADLQERLRAAGLERATVEVTAGRMGQPADLAITRVSVAAMATLCAVMCGPKAPRRVR